MGRYKGKSCTEPFCNSGLVPSDSDTRSEGYRWHGYDVDELIRQVTVNCAERGLLLLRVRDEIKMTMAAYQTLYQSSIAFGMRKALQAEQGKEDLITAAVELREQKIELEKTVAELRQKLEQTERRAAELREAEEKKHIEEIQFLKKTNHQLKTQMEGIIAPKK